MNQVNCSVHGSQDETFVCQHIVQGLEQKKALGFHWPADSTEDRPNAWCSMCNELVKAQNWEWTEEVLETAQVTLLCGACYDEAKSLNGF